MGTLISLAGWVVTWLTGALDWMLGSDITTLSSGLFDIFATFYRAALTWTVFLVGSPMGIAFWEVFVPMPLVALVLKCAIWFKGLVWSGGQA